MNADIVSGIDMNGLENKMVVAYDTGLIYLLQRHAGTGRFD